MLGIDVPGYPGIKFKSLREAYTVITGDSEVRGYLPRAKMCAQEAIIAADFPDLLGTSINRRVLKDYNETDYGERKIISEPILNLPNFKSYEGERVGYFGDLDDVDPEAADYVEATKPDEEKVSFSPIQKGNLLTLSRRAILNDDLRGLTKRCNSWGRAARRTFARFIWNFFINNSTYTGDSTAWFTAGGGSHGNLITDALSFAAVSGAIDTLATMTEPSSGERLGLGKIGGFLLVVPQELRATAFKINQATYQDANFTPNDLYQVFGAKNENILVNPLLTDSTDWGLFRDPADVDIMVAGFINGQQEPEILIADQPTIGQMFVADKIQYKIRHEYGAMIGDFRGAVKSEVP
jgi:hypothetical protein